MLSLIALYFVLSIVLHAVTAVLNYDHKNIKAVASVAGYSSNGGIMLEWIAPVVAPDISMKRIAVAGEFNGFFIIHKNIKAVASVAGYSSNGGIMLEWMKGTMGMGGFAYAVFPFAAICSVAEAGSAYNYTGVNGR